MSVYRKLLRKLLLSQSMEEIHILCSFTKRKFKQFQMYWTEISFLCQHYKLSCLIALALAYVFSPKRSSYMQRTDNSAMSLLA